MTLLVETVAGETTLMLAIGVVGALARVVAHVETDVTVVTVVLEKIGSDTEHVHPDCGRC